jgi:hypothetical protein
LAAFFELTGHVDLLAWGARNSREGDITRRPSNGVPRAGDVLTVDITRFRAGTHEFAYLSNALGDFQSRDFSLTHFLHFLGTSPAWAIFFGITKGGHRSVVVPSDTMFVDESSL